MIKGHRMSKKPYQHTSFLNSVHCAWKGFRWAVVTQRNLRFQLVLGAGVLVVGALAGLDINCLLVLLLTISMVLGFEMMNTALETFVDSVYPEFNEAAGHVKDVAAGAALLVAFFAFVIGLVLFWGIWEDPRFNPLAHGGTMTLMVLFVTLSLPKHLSKYTETDKEIEEER